jgi:hypothetical protein
VIFCTASYRKYFSMLKIVPVGSYFFHGYIFSIRIFAIACRN